MWSGDVPGQRGRHVSGGREIQLDSVQLRLDERIDPLETILRRERLIIGGCLAAMVLIAWTYLLHSKATMADMDMPGMVMPWGAMGVLLLFVMWAVMMVAMMVPSAAPMILAFLTVNHRRETTAQPLVPVGIFLFGYLAVWTAYSAVATLAQWGLHKAALLSPTMAATSPVLSGGLLLAAGVFQWTPLKRACLKGCRSPLSFLVSEWRDGTAGAFVMGLRHGSYCLGCCWILMALLFVAGVMNLLWVAVIALFVMAEKILVRGELLGHVTGVALVTAGIVLMARLW
jgi:predicted metal-binding membrane protein